MSPAEQNQYHDDYAWSDGISQKPEKHMPLAIIQGLVAISNAHPLSESEELHLGMAINFIETSIDDGK